jgi:hypothetical protein
VGFVRERIGNTDIALAQLNDGVVFENGFMEVDFSAKKFIHSRDQVMGDQYLIDSFSTGKRQLFGLGRRFEIKRDGNQRRKDLYIVPGEEDKLPPTDVAYIGLRQGAYVTNHPTIYQVPQIRDVCCGAVLLRCGRKKQKRDYRGSAAEQGEICGMMHYADLQSKHVDKAVNYICYADAFDPLINDGWKIVQDEEDDEEEEEAESRFPRKTRKGEASGSGS